MFIDRLLSTNQHAVVNEANEMGLMCFEVTNVARYLKGHEINKYDVPRIRPPYGAVWFEWATLGLNDIEMQSYDPTTGVYVEKATRKSLKTEGHLLVQIEESNGLLSLCMFTYNESIEGEIFPGHLPLVQCDKLGNLVPIANTYQGAYIPNSISAVVLMSLGFLNCKNVTILSNQPPYKLQAARTKKGKRPLVTYHILEIKPMAKILRDEGHSETDGLKRALHICRGHFKDYAARGLFGRHKGMYWWDAQVRGNTTEGISLKDYKVSP